MIRWILVTILTIGIAATAFWGYQEHQDKNDILMQAENTYQRAFHELSYHVDLLHDKIGASLAMNSDDRLSPQMVEIWRLTSEAQSNVGQLPLALLPFNKTEEFLSNIGNFTYRTAVRDLTEDPLSDKETSTLENLYKQSAEIKDELRNVQSMALKNNLRWMDVQLALATQDEQEDNTIINGFKTVEKKVEGYSESSDGIALMNQPTQDHAYEFLTGKKWGEKEAQQLGEDLFHVNKDEKNNITIDKSGDGADTPVYSLTYRNGDKSAYMDLTEQGGHPITLLVDRPVEDQELSLNEGLNQAEKYLKQFDYDGMEVFESSQYDHIGVYSFVYNEDDIRVYSDSIEVKVALDNGDILGFTAHNYLMNHRERDIDQPELTEADAEDKVSESVDIQETHLAIIDNDLGEEVLTYEFLGTRGQETYRIFINAENGTEEKVERLSGTEALFSQR